jgi:class 3 adenylate cyclase
VLFAAVQDFAALGDTLDAEDVGDLMNALWRELDAVIVAHGGSIDKHIGDSIMAMWGAEQAREDDPEQAVRAALAMRAGIADFGLRIADSTAVAAFQSAIPAPQSQIRIGINTGPVVLGAVGTTGEFTAMGDTVNVASRPESGRDLISRPPTVTCAVLVAGPRPLTVKGKAEPLQVYLVRAACRRRCADDARRRRRDRAAGRARHRMRVERRAAPGAVRGARGRQVVTVVGEAGIGKSRLLKSSITGWTCSRWTCATSAGAPVRRP